MQASSPFKKRKLAFNNVEVFGSAFKNDEEKCFCRVSKMIIYGKIERDGTIKDQLNLPKQYRLSKSDLWTYIYYLYSFNKGPNGIDVFEKMQDTDNKKASAVLFYNVVKSFELQRSYSLQSVASNAEEIPTRILASFINNVIETYDDSLLNPIIDFVTTQKEEVIKSDMKGIKFITGKKTGELSFVTGANVQNANIKVSLQRAGKRKVLKDKKKKI